MFVSVIMVRGLLSALKATGIEPEQGARLLGLEPEQLADPQARISFEQYDQIVTKALEITGDPGLGLTLAESAPESMLQLLGYLLMSCQTLREVCTLAARFMPLMIDGLTFSVSEQGAYARFEYDLPVPLVPTSRFGSDYTLLMGHRIAQHFVSANDMANARIFFKHEAPSYLSRYEKAFGCPVSFGQSFDGSLLPRAALDARQLHADPVTQSGLVELAERQLATVPGKRTTSERLRELLRYETALATVDVEKFARNLGLGVRSLRRKLASEGVTFSELLEEARCRVACAELKREVTVKEITERLGFSEPSAFHRAFKRWMGVTPLEYQRGA
jgi:AraC-like DNA-binding protein